MVQAYAHAMICTTVAWDVPGVFGALPQWWPSVSYVTAAAGIAAACIGVLTAILSAPQRARRTAGAGGPLVAAGILLGAWFLRGDAEIPPDPPLVIAEAAGAVLYVVSALRRPE